MRLIDADKLKSELFDADWMMDNDEHMVEKIVGRQPTVDAEPVRHGRWIKGGYACGEAEWKCSECHEIDWRTSISRFKYCPFCGAKMDGSAE